MAGGHVVHKMPAVSTLLLSLLFILYVTSTVNAAKLNKPVLDPSMGHLGPKLLPLLPTTKFEIQTWETGFIPEKCKLKAEKEKWSSSDLVVFSVLYEDCDKPWIFCRHRESHNSQRDMAEMFGRMPVKMRNYIRHALSLPGERSAGDSVGGDITFFGPQQDDQAITLWVHETGHSIDAYHGELGKQRFSLTPTWIDAYNKDPAVSGDYGRTSQGENFCQELVIALLDKNLPGGLDARKDTPQWHNVSNQVRTIQDLLGDELLPGGRCDLDKRMKWPGISDKVVCTPDGTNCLAATNSTWAKEHGHPYGDSQPKVSQGTSTPPGPPTQAPARAVRALSAPPPNQVGPQGGQQPLNRPKCQHLPPDSPPPPPPGYGDGSTTATTMVTSTTKPTKPTTTTTITTSVIATVTATTTITGSSTTIFAGVRTSGVDTRASTHATTNIAVPGYGPGPVPGSQGASAGASANPIPSKDTDAGNNNEGFKGPGPGPGPATHEITWENVPINKSSAAIAAESDKEPLPASVSNKMMDTDTESELGWFGYFDLYGHGEGEGCVPWD